MNINHSAVSFLSFIFAKINTRIVLLALMLCAMGTAWAQEHQSLAPLEWPRSEAAEVPFKGVFATQFQISVVFPIGYISVTGQGNASHLGWTAAVTTNQELNLITGEATATYTLTGANGDTVVLEMEFLGTNVPGGVTFGGSYTVAGGTGRFAQATGSGLLSGQATFTSASGGVGSFSVVGTISSPGR